MPLPVTNSVQPTAGSVRESRVLSRLLATLADYREDAAELSRMNDWLQAQLLAVGSAEALPDLVLRVLNHLAGCQGQSLLLHLLYRGLAADYLVTTDAAAAADALLPYLSPQQVQYLANKRFQPLPRKTA